MLRTSMIDGFLYSYTISDIVEIGRKEQGNRTLWKMIALALEKNNN
ncbi:MAG: hypothetical protein Q4C70_04945 [Planctomycetia bacterium]|nr:hypothetical protein [Planctomycetia bacterium]